MPFCRISTHLLSSSLMHNKSMCFILWWIIRLLNSLTISWIISSVSVKWVCHCVVSTCANGHAFCVKIIWVVHILWDPSLASCTHKIHALTHSQSDTSLTLQMHLVITWWWADISLPLFDSEWSRILKQGCDWSSFYTFSFLLLLQLHLLLFFHLLRLLCHIIFLLCIQILHCVTPMTLFFIYIRISTLMLKLRCS